MELESDLSDDSRLASFAIEVCATQLEFSAGEFLRTLQDLNRLLKQGSDAKQLTSLNSTLHARKLNELSMRVSSVHQITSHILKTMDKRARRSEFTTFAAQFLQLFGEKLAIVLEWCLFEAKQDSQQSLTSSVTSLIDDLTSFISRCRDEVRSDLLRCTFEEPKLITLQQVASLTNLSVPTLRRYKKKNWLPKPAFKGAGTQPDRWDASEVTRKLREQGKLHDG